MSKDSKDDKAKKNQLNIQLDENIANGTYSNLVIINHSSTEFVLDFVSVMPGVPKSKVKSRMILAPQHAKRLLSALSENIRRYESANGEIKDDQKQHQNIPMNFGPTGEA
ncbi:DUF3467 domain-containing protein [Psychroflexus sp. MBR-150]|jgi:competence protein ComGF